MGKVAVITGAGAGIGFAFSEGLAADGWSVAIADVDEAVGEKAAAELRAKGGDVVSVPTDIREKQSNENMAKAVVDRWGGIDLLVNNAGRHLRTYNQPVTTIDLDLWNDLFAVNLTGTVLATRACLPGLRARTGSSIVNISSIAGVTKPTGAYGVSKTAVIALTVAMAHDLGEEGIRVNCIAPGMVNSPAAMAALTPEFQANQISQQLLKRLGTMDDLLGALRYLVSDAATWVTGQTLVIDGGSHARV